MLTRLEAWHLLGGKLTPPTQPDVPATPRQVVALNISGQLDGLKIAAARLIVLAAESTGIESAPIAPIRPADGTEHEKGPPVDGPDSLRS